MKKSYLYLLGLVAMLISSCTDEAVVEQSRNELRITGSFIPETRTTFVRGEGVMETHWNVDDAIELYTEGQKNLRYTATTNGKSTEFIKNKDWLATKQEDLIVEENKTVYAIYPYSNDNDNISCMDSIMLPGNNGFLNGILFSEAQIKNGELNFQFRHLCSYLELIVDVQLIKDALSNVQAQYEGVYNFDIESAKIRIYSPSMHEIATFGSYYKPKTNEIIGSLYGGETKYSNRFALSQLCGFIPRL